MLILFTLLYQLLILNYMFVVLSIDDTYCEYNATYLQRSRLEVTITMFCEKYIL